MKEPRICTYPNSLFFQGFPKLYMLSDRFCGSYMPRPHLTRFYSTLNHTQQVPCHFFLVACIGCKTVHLSDRYARTVRGAIKF